MGYKTILGKKGRSYTTIVMAAIQAYASADSSNHTLKTGGFYCT